MIKYSQFSFAAPPRTGIAWFIEAAHLAGIDNQSHPAWQYMSPPDEGTSDFVVSLIRHPFDWLESLYFNTPCFKWLPINPALDTIVGLSRSCTSFGAFVGAVADVPGCIGEMFDSYGAASVLKLEDFPYAPIELFQMFGGLTNAGDHIRFLPHRNKGMAHIEDRSPALRRLIVASEPELCDRYCYY